MPKRRLETVAPPQRQCEALSRSGKRCSINERSKLRGPDGKLAAGPLLHGGTRCLYHMELFCVNSISLQPSEMSIFFCDTETTSLSVVTGEVVEIGCLSMCGACFSMIVCPAVLPGPYPPPVHGIGLDDLTQGTDFQTAFLQLAAFVDNIAEAEAAPDSGSSDDETESPLDLPRLPSNIPDVVIVAHNGLTT